MQHKTRSKNLPNVNEDEKNRVNVAGTVQTRPGTEQQQWKGKAVKRKKLFKLWRISNVRVKKHLQMRLSGKTAFINQHNFKNATAFFTIAFKRWAALNKECSFLIFVLVKLYRYVYYLILILQITCTNL